MVKQIIDRLTCKHKYCTVSRGRYWDYSGFCVRVVEEECIICGKKRTKKYY